MLSSPQHLRDVYLTLADALKVGGAIEEIAILDLRETIADSDHADIRAAYENLLSGSENHLRASVRTLERQTGETYEPQAMGQAAFDEIMAGANGNGRGRCFCRSGFIRLY